MILSVVPEFLMVFVVSLAITVAIIGIIVKGDNDEN